MRAPSAIGRSGVVVRGAIAIAVLLAMPSCDGGHSTQSGAIATAPAAAGPPSDLLRLPKKAGSVRFAAIGDSGRGDAGQYAIAAQMQAYRKEFPFDFVVMLGDNVYDGATREDYVQKFELPYKPLLDAGVDFYATIGNHDEANQPSYAPFHMGGQRYYTFKPPSLASRLVGPDVRFFMIDTERLDRTELAWIDREMGSSNADWKIPVFHRPIYTSGRYVRPARLLRAVLEPLFLKHGVTVAFSGHEHFYERIKPQNGITYFISGGAGSLRLGDLRDIGITDVGFDRDYHFMLVEISGDELYFQTISSTGASIDDGVIRKAPRRQSAVPCREASVPTC